jgi:ribosomal peptide maturation radical SAM protein 1
MGAALLKCAPWIDFVCSGEGDIAFVEFVQSFLKGEPYHKINGIITRQSNVFDISLTNPIMSMDSLPFPDFEDFFAAFRHSQLSNEISPELVIETSRGCWWGEKFQCTFCGLNGSTMKYRSKSISRVLDELRCLTNMYSIKKFQVVDNILDLKYIDGLFPKLHDQRLDVELFYETKSNISKEQLVMMRQGGVRTIQPGLETLSDSILKIMKKGVTALQNIQVLKWCRELEIIPNWNFIWGFPGEPEDEYVRMARVVQLLVHLHPPGGFGKINLDRFSPYFIEPLQNGITNVRPWKTYKFLYPLNEDDLKKIAYHFDFDYTDHKDPSIYTMELKQELMNWKKLWEDHKRTSPPILNMMRSGNLLMIKDTRPCSLQSFYVLTNEERMIYEICETIHSFQNIFIKVREDYPLITEEETREVLSNLVIKKLMICDNGKYLSLAIWLISS